MKLLRFMFVGILLVLIFEITLFSQYHVNSKVELSIAIEDGHPDPPTGIILIGTGKDNHQMYVVDIDLDINTKYTIYDVKPGKYLISINNYTGGIYKEIQIVTLYDPNTERFLHESSVRNGIEVYPNRNLKIGLSFKLNNDFSGFEKVMEKKFKDFDGIEYNIHSSPSSYTDFIQMYERLFTSEVENGHSKPLGTAESICGNKDGESKIDLNAECTRDNGNITVKLKSVYFKNKWLGEKGTGTQIGNVVMGMLDEETGLYTCGTNSLKFKSIIFEGDDSVPSTWPKSEMKYSCKLSEEKCKLEFTYYVGIMMETAVWDRVEMCNTLNEYNNKTVGGGRTCFCNCLFEAKTAHEEKHCISWINSIGVGLEKIDNAVRKDYKVVETCCTDENCSDQANELFSEIATDLYNFIEKVGDSPEDESKDAESEYFKRCITLRNCK